MTQYTCPHCKRILYKPKHECFHQEIADPNLPRYAATSWEGIAAATCRNCPHWTTAGNSGCSLIPKPCDIGYYRRKGRACFDDPPRFKSKYLEFPEFPWDSPGGKRAVCTIIIGDAAEELAQYTLPRIKRYAAKVDADLVIIDKDQYPAWPMANKFAIGSVVKNYERTYYVDIDVWIRDKCPNVFDTFDEGHIWLHQDADYLERNFLKHDSNSLSRPEMLLDCWNTGVVLQDQQHWDIWNPPLKMQYTSHTCEQSAVEIAIKDKNYSCNQFSALWNNQYWTKKAFWNTFNDAHVIHLSGTNNKIRVPILQRLVRDNH